MGLRDDASAGLIANNRRENTSVRAVSSCKAGYFAVLRQRMRTKISTFKAS
jgi:hypothetical protein